MTQSSRIVPKLRFPEFSDAWVVRHLGQIANITSGGTPNRSKYSYWNGSIPWITTSEINFNKINESRQYITEEGLRNSSAKLFSKDTILIALYGQGKTRGKVAKLGIDAATNQACAAVSPNQEIDSDFLFQDLMRLYSKLRKLSNEGSQKNLSGHLLKSISVYIPKKVEQEKIAEFLFLIDERIEKSEKKVELLKKYKKGVMQEIFTRQIQFKDENGNNYPEWKEKKVIDVYHFRATNSLSRDCLSDTGKFKNIHYGDIHKKYGTHLDTLAADIPKIYKAPRVLIEKFIPESTLQAKDVIMADASEDYNDIGKSLEIINTEDMTVAGLHTIVMRPNNPDDLALRFSAYMFNSYGVRKQIMKLATGVSVLGISLSNLMSVKLYLPTYGEQEKIADFLSSLDEKIELEAKRLDQAKQFKKFLLQRMFV